MCKVYKNKTNCNISDLLRLLEICQIFLVCLLKKYRHVRLQNITRIMLADGNKVVFIIAIPQAQFELVAQGLVCSKYSLLKVWSSVCGCELNHFETSPLGISHLNRCCFDWLWILCVTPHLSELNYKLKKIQKVSRIEPFVLSIGFNAAVAFSINQNNVEERCIGHIQF